MNKFFELYDNSCISPFRIVLIDGEDCYYWTSEGWQKEGEKYALEYNLHKSLYTFKYLLKNNSKCKHEGILYVMDNINDLVYDEYDYNLIECNRQEV